MAAKRDFGSFHSSNVQELLSIPDDQYSPPKLPFLLPSFKEYASDEPPFGAEMRSKHFLLEDSCVFLNHGAFGAVLKEALVASQQWQSHVEKQPLRFFDRELLPTLVYVSRKLATFVGCKPNDIVLISNVTTGINSVMRSQKFTEGDRIYYLSTEYGANKKIIEQVCRDTGAVAVEQFLELPITGKQEIIDLVASSIPEGTTFAVFDHISSNTPFIMPVRELVAICHQRNIKVLVDGAHSLGQIKLDIESIGAEYYTTNAHKWFCAPKGAALLFVKPSEQEQTHPAVISHGMGSGFNSEFIWQGLHDYSPMLSLLTVMEFWNTVGEESILHHNHSLVINAAKMLSDVWKSGILAPADMTGSLCCVRLPGTVTENINQVTYQEAEIIQNLLYHQYQIEVPIKSIQGELYVRISAHVYNTIGEYEKLGAAILAIAEQNVLLK